MRCVLFTGCFFGNTSGAAQGGKEFPDALCSFSDGGLHCAETYSREVWNMKTGDHTGGYLTIEAAMIMPVVLGIVILVMRIWFFRYDNVLV